MLISWSKRRSFLTEEIGRKMIFPKYFRKITIFEEPRKINFQALKNSKMIFSFARNSMLTDFWRLEIRSLLRQEAEGKMIFNDYWKKCYFSFFGDEKYGLFWAKIFLNVWYLSITQKLLFWTFWGWEIRSFEQKKLMERWYLNGLLSFLL